MFYNLEQSRFVLDPHNTINIFFGIYYYCILLELYYLSPQKKGYLPNRLPLFLVSIFKFKCCRQHYLLFNLKHFCQNNEIITVRPRDKTYLLSAYRHCAAPCLATTQHTHQSCLFLNEIKVLPH